VLGQFTLEKIESKFWLKMSKHHHFKPFCSIKLKTGQKKQRLLINPDLRTFS
jgi:hypothetical protein